MRSIGSVLFLSSLLLGGCEVEEYALLLEVTVDFPVEILDVEVRSLERDETIETEARALTPEEAVAAADPATPLRVTVSVPGPLPVMVKVSGREGQEGGGLGRITHGAFRCYVVDGVVRDAFRLVPATTADLDGDGWPGDLSMGCGVECAGFECPAFLADCNDDNGSFNPGAIEICGADLNCDGMENECADEDGDLVAACAPGLRGPDCDCDDQEPLIYPGAPEDCGSSVDRNCDGLSGDLCDRDMDGSPADREMGGRPDCNDLDPAINPMAIEVCAGPGEPPVDENCNGVFDEGLVCAPDDLDGDGVLPVDGDCDDCDPGSSPTRVEACGDGVDQDCDMMDLMCAADDTDGDGERAVATGGRDCDDDDPQVNTLASEQCTGRADEDCDGMVDEGCMRDDTDGDGYVEVGAHAACEGDAGRTPGLPEICDGIDQDCDGIVDEDAAGAGGACIRDLDGTAFTVDYADSVDHCGGCRVACHRLRSDRCVDGECQCSFNGRRDEAPCEGVEVCCDGMGSGCRDLDTDMDNCGSCDTACDDVAADRCEDGQCRCGTMPPCGSGLQCCSGQCVDLDLDPNNCSRCGAQCGSNETCEGGLCTCYGEQADDPGDDACTGSDRCCRRHRDCRSRNSCNEDDD